MFGKNPHMKQSDAPPSGWLNVKEVFSTIQGEGPFSGVPATFVRLAGCNLACHFCDTDFSEGSRESVDEVVEACASFGNELVVLTGGEPLMQDVSPLIIALRERAMRVQIETAGTVWPASLYRDVLFPPRSTQYNTLVVVSPKTPDIHHMAKVYATAFKYLVSAYDAFSERGIPICNTQKQEGHRAELYAPADMSRFKGMIFLQPMEAYALFTVGDRQEIRGGRSTEQATRANTKKAVELCQKHGYRLSLQLHKILGLR